MDTARQQRMTGEVQEPGHGARLQGKGQSVYSEGKGFQRGFRKEVTAQIKHEARAADFQEKKWVAGLVWEKFRRRN